jgi:hypothetical protein
MFLDFHRTSKDVFVISADVDSGCGESTHTQVGRVVGLPAWSRMG